MTIVFGDWSSIELVEHLLQLQRSGLVADGWVLNGERILAKLIQTHFQVLFFLVGRELLVLRRQIRWLSPRNPLCRRHGPCHRLWIGPLARTATIWHPGSGIRSFLLLQDLLLDGSLSLSEPPHFDVGCWVDLNNGGSVEGAATRWSSRRGCWRVGVTVVPFLKKKNGPNARIRWILCSRERVFCGSLG